MCKNITICGKASLKALRGTVQVNGYDVRPNGESVAVYSSNCSSLITLNVVDISSADISPAVVNKNLKKKIAKVGAQYAVVELSHLDCAKCDYVTSIEPSKKLFNGSGYELSTVGIKLMSHDYNTFVTANDYVTAADTICVSIKCGRFGSAS